jgi:hypothetical protein
MKRIHDPCMVGSGKLGGHESGCVIREWVAHALKEVAEAKPTGGCKLDELSRHHLSMHGLQSAKGTARSRENVSLQAGALTIKCARSGLCSGDESLGLREPHFPYPAVA